MWVEFVVSVTKVAMWALVGIAVGMFLVAVWEHVRVLIAERTASPTKQAPAPKPSPWKVEFVECHPAFVWTCDHCGRDSFERTLVPELSSEEMHEAAVKLGVIDEWQSVEDIPSGLFYVRPVYVTCKYCGMLYCTVDR